MKQVLIRRGQVRVEDVPAPLVCEGHALVEVSHSLISSGTEISSLESSGQPLAKQALQRPDQVKRLVEHLQQQGVRKTVAKLQGKLDAGMPTGYSCSGFVIQVGPGVTDIRPGDRVACAGSGLANHAEMVLVPRNLLVKIPDGCDQKAAASVTLGAIAMQGVRRAEPRLGEIVAVIGLGLLGQITVQLLRAAGCRVIGIDLDARRTALASDLGAELVLVPSENDLLTDVAHFTGHLGADATIITAAARSDAVAQQAMQITRRKGRVIVVGDVGLGLKRSPFYEKEIDFLISCSYGPGRYDAHYERQGVDYPYAYVRWTENRNMAEYLRLVAEGKIQLGSILEREYDVSRALEAYQELASSANKPLGILLRYAPDGLAAASKTDTRTVLRSVPKSGKIGIAVVGAGSFATQVHLPNIQRLSDLYQLRAIVSATGSKARSVAQAFGAEYASTDYQDVLRDDQVDAVLISTRHHLHAGFTVAALAAGKHVFCEKPVALTEEQLNQVLGCYGSSVADLENGTLTTPDCGRYPVLMVGLNRRFAPAAVKMREITSRRKNPLMAVYRVNAGYMPVENWVHGAEGGGRILGEACHMLDLFTYLVGAPITSVSENSLQPASQDILASDNSSITVCHADGSVCTLFYTALGSRDVSKEYLEVYVDGKVLILDDFKDLTVHGAAIKGWHSAQQDKGHEQALRAFGQCITAHDSPWPISLHEIATVARATLVAGRAGQ